MFPKRLFNIRLKSSRYFSILVLVIFLFISFLAADFSLARDRFEEGDWIAWGDTRKVYDIEVGRNYIFFGTKAGVLRWDRQTEEWLYPWYTVPGYLDKAILLTGCTRVHEDPLTLDLYIKSWKEWYFRDNGTEKWEIIDSPPGTAMDRIKQKENNPATPGYGMIFPPHYGITQDKELEYYHLRWPFTVGENDTRNRNFFAWENFGVGIVPSYTATLELYPGGPGRSTAIGVNEDVIVCASELNRENGVLYTRDRSSDRWEIFHPDIEWGLEPGKVNRVSISEKGTIWLATTEGAMVRHRNSWRHIRRQEGLPRNVVNDILAVGEYAWAATRNGLVYIDERSGTVLKPNERLDPVPYNHAFSRLAADGDTIWAAGTGRLYHNTPEAGWRADIVAPTIGAATYPKALFAKDGILAIGDRMGFAWRDTDGKWHELFSSRWNDGEVLSITRHQGIFWLGTDVGLVKYNPSNGKIYRFTQSDGLAGKKVFEVIPEGDWLWLGTNKALVRFKWNVPERID